jgi:membrane-associated phospholipid phosphatase
MNLPHTMLLLLYNDAMLIFLKTLPQSLFSAFKGKNLLLQLVAFALTALIVLSDFDWWWHVHTDTVLIRDLSYPSILVGSFLPLVLPLAIIVVAHMRRDKVLILKGWFLGQASLLALVISSIYKAFTGRIPPVRASLLDISHQFNFGFLREGVFWGWPSSHTATNVALAVAFWYLFPKSKWKYVLIIFALWVGLGTSTTIHWFSEFVAGTLIALAIGRAVALTAERQSA